MLSEPVITKNTIAGAEKVFQEACAGGCFQPQDPARQLSCSWSSWEKLRVNYREEVERIIEAAKARLSPTSLNQI